MLLSLINRPCTLHKTTVSETETDGMGNPKVVETDTATVCELQQQQRFENRDGQQVLVALWQVFLKPGEDVTGWDSLTVDGQKYSLEGPPWEVRHPRRQTVHHIEATARQVS